MIGPHRGSIMLKASTYHDIIMTISHHSIVKHVRRDTCTSILGVSSTVLRRNISIFKRSLYQSRHWKLFDNRVYIEKMTRLTKSRFRIIVPIFFVAHYKIRRALVCCKCTCIQGVNTKIWRTEPNITALVIVLGHHCFLTPAVMREKIWSFVIITRSADL